MVKVEVEMVEMINERDLHDCLTFLQFVVRPENRQTVTISINKLIYKI